MTGAGAKLSAYVLTRDSERLLDRVLSALAAGGGGELLAPSYHCRTMLDAAVARGARVTLYPLTPSLAPDLDALAAMLKARKGPSTIVLSTHFFGFPAPIAEVLALCHAAGATLIEDCSHCLVDGSGLPVGRAGASDGHGRVHGDFVIASPYKMFPAQDGGTLVEVVQSGFPTVEIRDFFVEQAWTGAFDRLTAYLTRA